MITISYILQESPETKGSLSDVLKLIISRTRFLAGCELVEQWYKPETSQVMIVEIWRSEADLVKYLNSFLFKKMLAALELSSSRPLVRFSDCSSIQGFEAIEKLITKYKLEIIVG